MRPSILFLGILGLSMKVLAEESCSPGAPGENLALNKDVSSSSEATEESSSNAVDGNPKTCFEAEYEEPSWLTLDLGRNYRINTVVVKSLEHIKRLDGAEVKVGKTLAKTQECQMPKVGSTPSIICCYGMEGRYVTINMKERKESFTFCEVEVYGSPVSDTVCEE